MMDRLAHLGFHLAVDIGRLSLWLALLSVLFLPLERAFRLASGPRSWRVTAVDLGYFYLNGLVPAIALSIPLAVLVGMLNVVTPQAYRAAVGSLPFGLKLAAALVVGELGSYWGHRWSHEHPLLWRFHAAHHAPEHLSWLVNTRAHPVDIVFTRLCGLVPIYVLGFAGVAERGASSMIPVYVTLLGTLWAFFIHANVRWRLGFVEAIVSTPAFHHWHHTNDEYRDRNYASLFPWIDRIFGTYHLPRNWPSTYGIDHALPSGFVSQLTEPFRPRSSGQTNPTHAAAATDSGTPARARSVQG